MFASLSRAVCLFLLVAAIPAAAQDEDVPYWASIRADEVNMRVGPAESYRIAWVYRQPLLPVRVVRRSEGWRLVEDPDGARGWILARFLSRTRGAIVRGGGLAEMRQKGTAEAHLLWRLEPGVVGKLGDCDAGWCRLDVAGHIGFVAENRLWNVDAP